MMTLGNQSNNELIPILYFFQRAMYHPDIENREDIIALTSILPHPINTYADQYEQQIIHSVNEKEILSLTDLQVALENPIEGYHILTFEGKDTPFILDAKTLPSANRQIQLRYGIMQPYVIHDNSSPDLPNNEYTSSKGE
jgi:hypothetical protein